MNFFEEDEELKREIEEEVQRLRLEERKKYVHEKALAILKAEKDKVEYQKAMEQNRIRENAFLRFIEEKIIKTNNKEDSLGSMDIYNPFKQWYKENYPGQLHISMQDFDSNMMLWDKLGPKSPSGPTRFRWVGYQVKID
jgi:hypothetical protein